MFSIVTAILKATIGLIVNKGRDLAAEKLKDGDVTDQQFRNLVVRELDDIKSKIDGLAKKDLLASVSFLKEGLMFLYQLLDQSEFGKIKCHSATALLGKEDEKLAVSLPSASGGSKRSVNTSSLVEEVKMLKLNERDAMARLLLTDAKERFKDARRKATEAFNNEGLKISDRIQAMKIRIMATLMEKFDSPVTVLASCRLCLEELHNTPAVQNCFEVETTKPIRYRFNKNERREVIADVCHMNFVVYSVTRVLGGPWRDVFKWPFVNTGKLRVDPLRNDKLFKALKHFNLEHFCLREWTFGGLDSRLEGAMDHRLCGPWGITTNTQGQFIVADFNRNVKVFDPTGKMLCSIYPLTEDEQKQLSFKPWSVATDGHDNLYVLASLVKRGIDRKEDKMVEWSGVYVFDCHHNLHHKFPLREEVTTSHRSSLTVTNDGKVFVLLQCDVYQVDVYESDGRFAYSFGRGILSSLVRDITTANNDRVLVMDGRTHSVHVFSTEGDHIRQFAVEGDTAKGSITFHHPSEHVIVCSMNRDNENRGQVSIYTKDGEFVRSVRLNTDKKPRLSGLTMTVDGRVAVTNHGEHKVHIIPF